MSKEAFGISKDQLALSNALINKDEAAFKKWLDGQGFSPETEAAMLSQFRNSVSQQFAGGMANLKSMLASRGGYQPGGFGGTDVGRIAGFEANQARTLSAGELGLKLYAEQQNAARKQFAGTLYGALAGTQANTATGFGNISSNFMGTAQQAAARADQPSPLWGVLGSVIGAGASIASGGLSNLAGAAIPPPPTQALYTMTNTNPGYGMTPCWIAEALYGVTDWRTHLLRYWLNNVWAKRSRLGAATMWLYGKVGVAVSRAIYKHPRLGGMFRPLFDYALTRALVS